MLLDSLKEAFQNDCVMFSHWAKSESFSSLANQQNRTGISAARAFSFIAMAYGSFWGLSTLANALVLHIKIVFNLTLAISIFALGHDVFTESYNFLQPDFKKQNSDTFFDFLTGRKIKDEGCVRQFTKNTYLKNFWMSYYIHGLYNTID